MRTPAGPHPRNADDSANRPVLDAAARVSVMLDRALRILLIGAAVAVFVVAVLILATMDDASRSQGGRVYVTIAAIFILGAIDGAYGRLEYRRRPFWMEGPGEAAYRRYLYWSLGLLLAAAVTLIALAIYLP
jgi:hypothetical protein